MGVLDKVRKFKNSRPKNEGRTRTRGIFHDWQDGENRIRLVGEFLEVKTHFIAPAQSRGDRGLCQADAFAKDNSKKISKVVNCPDWDIEKEEMKDKKTCPICKLYRLAVQALKEDPNDEEKKYFEALKSAARVRTNLKWNVFDRENPNVTVIDENGNEAEQKGLKIATIGMEAWDDIEGIFAQCGFDITDPAEGVDIKVIKGHNGTRTAYSAQVVIEGTGLAVTPFDEEELAIVGQPHELKAICGKKTEASAIRDALHGDYADLLELNDEDDDEDDTPADDTPADETTPKEEEAVADEPAADEAVDEGDDEDDVLGGTSQKKKK
jgi:hypothetical protein